MKAVLQAAGKPMLPKPEPKADDKMQLLYRLQ